MSTFIALFRSDNGVFHKATYNDKVGMGHIKFPKNIVLLSLKSHFVLANSADPDEIPHSVAFHLGLHCFPKYPLRGFCHTKGLT